MWIDLDAIRRGRTILFLGAAVHAPPPEDSTFRYSEDQRVPGGRSLSRLLASASDFQRTFPQESPDDLQRVALHVETSQSRARLVQLLAQHLNHQRRASPALQMLAELPFRIVVTTNYDRLFESALREAGKDPRVLIYNPRTDQPTLDLTEDPSVERPLLFKMHGDLDSPPSIVITDEDYIQFIQRMASHEAFHPVPQTVRFRMGMWPTLFVGYSLRDYNLRLLFRTPRWRLDPAAIPAAYSVDRSPDPLILKVWQDTRHFVTFIAQDLWQFVPWLHEQALVRAASDD
jgi:hypothetical protein